MAIATRLDYSAPGAAFDVAAAIPVSIAPLSASLPMADSLTGTTGVIAAVLPAAFGRTNYLTGFQVGAGGATAGGSAIVTVKGVVGGTQNFVMTWGVVATGGLPPPLVVNFSTPLVGLPNTSIIVSFPGQGAGGLNEAVSVQGYSIPNASAALLGSTMLWLDASDRATITLATGASAWADKTGNGIIASQATGALQPTVVTAAQNGLNTLRFTGASSQTMAFASSINATPSYTLFTVYKKSAISTIAVSLGSAPSATNYANTAFSDGNLYMSARNTLFTAVDPNTAVYNLITSRVSPSSGTLRFNLTPVTAVLSAAAGADAVWTNLGQNGTLGFSDAALAELMLFPGGLSDAQITLVETYLRTKWATP